MEKTSLTHQIFEESRTLYSIAQGHPLFKRFVPGIEYGSGSRPTIRPSRRPDKGLVTNWVGLEYEIR